MTQSSPPVATEAYLCIPAAKYERLRHALVLMHRDATAAVTEAAPYINEPGATLFASAAEDSLEEWERLILLLDEAALQPIQLPRTSHG